MSLATPYPTQLDFHGKLQIARWRPLVQWLLAIPHLFIAYALSMVRAVLILISFFTVLFTRRIPRPLFDAIAMTFRYEWRAALNVTPTSRGLRPDLLPPFKFFQKEPMACLPHSGHGFQSGSTVDWGRAIDFLSLSPLVSVTRSFTTSPSMTVPPTATPPIPSARRLSRSPVAMSRSA